MGEIFRIFVEMFVSTKESIDHILSYPRKVTGIILGVLGYCAFPFLSLAARVFMNKSNSADVMRTLALTPLLSVLLFIGGLVFVFAISRLFRGKGNIFALAATSGWGGIYNIASALLLLPIFPLSQTNQTPGSPTFMVLAVPALFSVLGFFFVTFRAVAFQVRVISRVFELKIGAAIFVFVVTAIPFFIVYDKVF